MQDRGRALPVRRMLDQFDALVGADDRIVVVAGGGGKIVQRVDCRPARCSEAIMSSATSPS